MIMDCHTHINCPLSDVETAAHLEATEKVDACIVLGGGEGSSSDVNKELGRYVKQHRKMAGFGVFDPTADMVAAKSVKSITLDAGLVGAVLYCAKQGFHPAHSRAMRFYEAAQELGLPVFFHNYSPSGGESVLDYARPYLLGEIARRFPSLKMIIGSMGAPFFSETICMVGKYDNVYADLTVAPGRRWQVYNMVLSAFEAGVMNKLIFGSGFPRANAADCIEMLLGFNRLMADTNLPTVPREEIRAVVERDSFKLLGIKAGT